MGYSYIRPFTKADLDRRKNIIKQKIAIARQLRKKEKDRKKGQQRKSELLTSQTRNDENIDNSKKARNSSSTAKEQSVATPGDLVPIVFCRRDTSGPQTGEVGGVWMQPTKLKQASYNFDGIFLYPISQGEIDSNFVKHLTYVGETSLTARGNNPTLNKYYSSAATMAAAPNVCPITSGKIFCHPDATSYIDHVRTPDGFTEYFPNFYTQYHEVFELTIGSGDTSNTTFSVSGSDLRIFEVESGDDRTSAYWTAQGISPSATAFGFNFQFVSGSTSTGRAVGTIFNFLGNSPGSYRDPISENANPAFRVYWTIYGSSADDKPIAWEYGSGALNLQTDPSDSATDETLGAVVHEVHMSPVADPTNFPSGYDFTDYADITFLEIQGDLYDESNPLEGEYKTTTRQLSMLVEKGVRVPLYSAGTPGSTNSSQHFVDLAMYLFALNKRVIAGTTADIASPIDTSNLQALASFHTNFGLFFNGMIEQTVNIIDYISTMAPFFFVSFVSENGRYALKPLLPLTAANEIDTTALTPTATFTDSEIIPGTFQKEYVEGEERRDAQISVVYRESRKDRIGFQKSSTIRFSSVDSDVRLIQYDMTDFCVTESHAQNFAKFQLAIRKHSTHTISFDTPLLTSSLAVTDIIRVQRVRLNSVGDDRTETDHYQVTSITHSTDGITTIAAMHFPLNGSNVAEISNEVINGSYTVT